MILYLENRVNLWGELSILVGLSLLIKKSAYISFMDVTLKTLLKNLSLKDVSGKTDINIQAISTDSRRTTPCTLFFALSGLQTDGNLHIDEAIDRGAVAIISEKDSKTHRQVTCIQVDNIRSVLAEVARRFHHNPERDIELIGVTGTNGKTTVSFLLKHLLEDSGNSVGMIGTVQYYLGQRTLPAYRTTPESADIYGMLSQMRDAKCREAVMEVSTHGIDQERVSGLKFKIAVFLNLTRDHIDYHHSMEEYFQVKCKLFNGDTGCLPSAAVVNSDDPYGRRLIEQIGNNLRVLSFGVSDDADIYATDVKLNDQGSQFILHWPGGSEAVSTGLLGHYNLSNVLAAFTVLYAMGRDPSTHAARLLDFPGVPGRMERIENDEQINLLVDYAHTDDALKNALSMLRTITKGRLLVVFGCGGNRDREKRPMMTRAVMEQADFAWATADNPRNESQDIIFADMKSELKNFDRIRFIEDRRRAIDLAIESAKPDDCVLIAGKGHETFQVIKDSVVPFDDRQVARELLGIKRIKKK